MIDEPIEVDGKEYRITGVSMGNPHAVVFLDHSPKELDLTKIGPSFEHHKCFPDRVNTEFVRVLDRKTVEMRVWERGSGETMACGTEPALWQWPAFKWLYGRGSDGKTSGWRSEDLLGQKGKSGLYDRTGNHRF